MKGSKKTQSDTGKGTAVDIAKHMGRMQNPNKDIGGSPAINRSAEPAPKGAVAKKAPKQKYDQDGC